VKNPGWHPGAEVDQQPDSGVAELEKGEDLRLVHIGQGIDRLQFDDQSIITRRSNQALDTECTEAEPEDTEHPRWMGIFCRGSNLCALAS
jgi:hypothetical protein